MNITGYGQYSKQIAGIKDPRKIMDQQHKLIFIYPMLYADKIKIPNLETLLRDFISVTFLSDLFVENAFNVIGIANQIRPLWDENRQAVDPTAALVQMGKQQATEQGVYTSQPSLPNYPVGPEASGIVQQKITQKTAVIQQLLKTDPKFAKTRPFIEMITLGNMIEIPVIVGTTTYPTDTLTLMYVLIAAIGLNRKLNNKQDVDFIFRELENMNEKKYWSLLDNLLPEGAGRKSLIDWFEEQRAKLPQRTFNVAKKISGWSSPTISSAARNIASRLQKRIENPPELNRERAMLTPLLLNKQTLDQTKLYFNFVLDPFFAKKRLGIDVSSEAAKLTELSQAKFQGELGKIQKFTVSEFSEIVSTVGIVLLRSIVNLVSVTPSQLDFLELKKINIDKYLIERIDDDLIEILIAVDNGLKGSSSEESRNKIKILKSFCKIDSSGYISEFSELIAKYNIESDNFNYDDYKRFISAFDTIVNGATSLSNKLENELKYMVSSQEQATFSSRLKSIKQDIAASLAKFFKEYQDEIKSDEDAYLRIVDVTDTASALSIANQMIPKLSSGVSDIFYFILLVKLQSALCQFILTAEVDLETVSHEVTAWPNYVLVLPVEIILALHAATMGKSWQYILSGEQPKKPEDTQPVKPQRTTKEQISERNILNANESYIKSIIKYISNRLDVPNLIIVDSKKGDIYYKLMNQSDINKTKISTIDTFIQSKLNRQIISQY